MRINPIASTTPAISLATIQLTPAAPASPVGVKRVSFAGIKKAASDGKTKTVYPVLPDEQKEAATIALRIVRRSEEMETLEGAIKTDKAELRFMANPFYFQVNKDKREVPSSVAVHYADEKGVPGELLITYQNRYGMLPDDSSLLPILGDRVDEFFVQDFTLKIEGDKLPQASVPEIIAELQTLFARYNCSDALEVKDGIKPRSEFHLARHSELTPEVNLALEQVCPIIPQIKTKGRK